MKIIIKLFIVVIWVLFLDIPVMSQKTQQVYLSGKGIDDAVNWEFYCTDGRKSGEWTTIPVPSCWEQHGYGTYNYGHDADEIRGKETGIYRFSFHADRDWKGKQVKIIFDGSMTDTEVELNGKPAGPVHQGAFYRFSHNIGDLLEYGRENELNVTVKKHSANESVNDAERRADYWIFGGIFRPVFLEIKPEENIDRVAVNPSADGTLTAGVYFNNLRKSDRIEVHLYDRSGNQVGNAERFSLKNGEVEKRISVNYESISTWTPETPHLYEVEFRLMNRDETVHIFRERIGFRTVEVKERDGIYVNGVKIRLKGVNRHSFWPETGRATSKKLSVQDVLLMKEMNMNAVRMSHYPPDVHFLDACDSLGLFVLDELAGWQASYDTEVGKKLVREMVIRDVNHPSIIIWDNGNEGGWNTELDDEFAKYDPQKRIVIHPWEKFRKTDTNHYIDFNYGTHDSFNGTHIYFPTEFLHGLYDGGHGAGLEDYWNLMRSRPRAAGGFLWVFADEAVFRTDMDGFLDTDGNHAPDGIVGPYREKEGSFFTIKELWAPLHFKDILITDHFNGVMEVENRYHYTNLMQCNFLYELVNFPPPGDVSMGYKTLEFGQIKSPRIEPGEKGLIRIDLPENWKDADALYIRVLDPYGNEIYTWDWAISLPEDYFDKHISLAGDKEFGLSETGETVAMSASGVKVYIDKNTGILERISVNDTIISLEGGPVLAEGNAEFIDHTVSRSDRELVYQADFAGNQQQIKWTLHNNGILQLNVVYYPNNDVPYFGINFNYPEDKVNGVRWLGNGPYRVWKNRPKGNRLNVWEKAYNNTVTGESYNYPEFKGYHAALYWAIINNEEKPFTVYTTTENLYLRLFTPDEPKGGSINAKMIFPEGDISFLQGISAIGTKFKKPEALGPQSQLNMYRRHRTDRNLEIELYFDFR